VQRSVTCDKNRFMPIRPNLRAVALVSALFLVSCNDKSVDPGGENPPVSFLVFSGNNQTGAAGAELALPLKVLATDPNNQPIANQVVNFVVTAGGGSVFAGTGLTDANGIAAEIWRVGTVAGLPQTVEVRAVAPDGTKQVFGVFTANVVAAAPDTIVIHAGDGQTVQVGQAVPVDPAVRLTDRFGNPVGGHSVTFSVTGGGGAVTGSPATSNSAGIATVGSWTLGPAAGPNTLRAIAAGLPSSPIDFAATAEAIVVPQFAIATQPSPSAQSGVLLGQQPAIQLETSTGQPINQAGVPVTVAISTGGGTLSGTLMVETDATGRATFTDLAISGLVGTRTLEFTSPGIITIVSNSIALAAGPAAQVTVNDGDAQSVNAGFSVTVAPSVLVRDASGNPVQGAQVTFAISAGGGSLAGAVQTSDVNGVARVGSWTLGPLSGGNGLTATVMGSGITGNPVAFTATALGNFWSSRASMAIPRRFAAMGVINGQLLVAGGKDAALTTRRTLEIYNPATNTWVTRKDLLTARVGAQNGVINGLLYVAGGNNTGGSALATMEVYNPATNVWTTRASMPAPKAFGASAVINGILYVAGGATTGGQTSTVFAYDPASNTWSTRASLPAVRNDLVGVPLNNLMYVIGGQQVNSNDGALQSYDPVTDSWTTRATMITPRFHVTAEVIGGLIYVAGGLIGTSTSSPVMEVYDPATDSWSSRANPITTRCCAMSGAIGGILYLAGGSNSGTVFGITEAYVP
jgi:N-acetylneuraminic acid mutarotase